jgi:hypothetical protein
MCGRYRLSRRKQFVEEYFDCPSGEPDWTPCFNIAPTQPVPAIRQNPKESVRELSLMPWGLIPSWATDGRKHKHPIQEASEAVSRLEQRARRSFDEFLLLRFVGTNIAPFPFSWVDENSTLMEYSALLTRVSREYDRRFA